MRKLRTLLTYISSNRIWLVTLACLELFFVFLAWFAYPENFLSLVGLMIFVSLAALILPLVISIYKRKKIDIAFRCFLLEPDDRNEYLLCESFPASMRPYLRELGQHLRTQQEYGKEQKLKIADYENYIEKWAHEIKKPLSLMTLLLDNRKGEMSPLVHTRMLYVRDYARQSVEQILYFSRLGAVHKDYCFEQLSVLETCREAVEDNLSDEDAWIYVIETNVLQRSFSEMLPSEKAAVLTLRYSKMICQGRRNDIVEELKRLENPDEIRENGTCGIECHKSKSRDVVGAEYDLKGRAVANYLRINELITPLKRRIDDAEFPIVVAVQLSYLTEQEQQMVDDVLSESEYKVNEGKVVLLREYTGKLTPERTEQILSGEFNRKPKKSTATAFKVKPAIYKKYFTASISQKEFDSIVDEALALYFAQKGHESEQEAG